MYRPVEGELVAFCVTTVPGHQCWWPFDRCWWLYGWTGDYKKTWVEGTVFVRDFLKRWHVSDIHHVFPAVLTFAGPIRQEWRLHAGCIW